MSRSLWVSRGIAQKTYGQRRGERGAANASSMGEPARKNGHAFVYRRAMQTMQSSEWAAESPAERGEESESGRERGMTAASVLDACRAEFMGRERV